MVSDAASKARDGYDAARQTAAVVDRSDRGRLVLKGADRRTYLHGLLTNDIAVLSAGQGCYAAYLTPQGRMITDLWVYELGDAVLVTLSRDVKDAVLAKFDQFLFSEDVQLGDVSDAFSAVAVIGPKAAGVVASVLEGVSEADLSSLPANGNRRATFGDEAAIVLRITDTGVPGYEVLIDRAHRPALDAALTSQGAVPIDQATAETLRIEAGVPRFQQDMDEDTIPLEAGIEGTAISLTKGCYVGQEVIIRVLHRGHGRVAKKLVGLTIDGDTAPAPKTVVSSEGREIGHVTSSTVSPTLGKPIALAYVHRDFVEPGTSVQVDGRSATVTALPFMS